MTPYFLGYYGSLTVLIVAVVTLLAAVLWVAARLVRPAGKNVRYGRAVCAATCMLPLNMFTGYAAAQGFLPDWGQVFLCLLTDYLVILLIIRLPKWRTLFPVAVYYSSQSACAIAAGIVMSYLRLAIRVP